MKIRISPDYFCSPLWQDDYSNPGDNQEILPENLPISAGLIEALWAWAYEFDAILNMADPILTGFSSPEAERSFEQKGLELARQLSRELGDISVRFRFNNIDETIP